MARLPPQIEVFAQTIYAEARGEPSEGKEWVAWVIKNRAQMDRPYWGGSSIKGVCLMPGQFECWNNRNHIEIDPRERGLYNYIRQLAQHVYYTPYNQDPTGGADHYNNPAKEGYPPWTNNCQRLMKIGNLQFYKDP